MEARKSGEGAGLDAMSARSATEVLQILRSAAPGDDGGREPVGMWKAGWQARTEDGAPDRHGDRKPVGMWKSGWDIRTESPA